MKDANCISSIRYVQKRGYRFAHPLLYVKSDMEDESLGELKSTVADYIDKEKKEGHLQSASVYFRKLDSPSWFDINPSEEFTCASLFKVPVMIAMLAQEDKQPGYLDRKVLYLLPETLMENVQPLENGKYYTLRELIRSMVSRSDNIAYDLCWKNMDQTIFNNLLKDLHVRPFDTKAIGEYNLDTKSYSRFFRVLYNASYLSAELSEFALHTLADSDFNGGMVKNIGKQISVPRKFGTRYDSQQAQLHEFGIFYCGSEPYLLGVMTKGATQAPLYPVLNEISSLVYYGVKCVVN